ncbi:MAG: TetR/AcrR family transcriptional regulator [Planctomycetaceae bacterium]|nr:TetR/AcrR family transcriptional regulator [Planctomycetaceae bacterium]
MRLSKARKACVTAMMKETIFEAANSVLERHGANGLTMDRVATQVGLTTGSLYNYFRDKNELLQCFYTRLVEPGLQAIEETASTELPAPQKLENILRTAWQYAVEHRGLIRLLAGANQGDEVRKEVRPRFLRMLTAIFEQGIREGDFRPHNPALTGRMVLGCLTELFELQAEDASQEEIDEYVRVLIDAALHGFSIHAGKASKPAGRSRS